MKKILITGATSGIGEELAIQYAAAGVQLFLTGRDEGRLASVAEKCRNKGATVTPKAMSVCDREDMAEWIGKLPPLDIVVANAGISGGFGGQDIQDIINDYQIFETNLTGVLNTIYPALPKMVDCGSGQIVIISSLASYFPMPSAPAYSASKVAVRTYGEALAAKLRPYHIDVTVICPGFIKSGMTDKNDFPMPFLMETREAVSRMKLAIDRKVTRLDFPKRMAIPLKILTYLPDFITRAIFAYLPEKKRLPKI